MNLDNAIKGRGSWLNYDTTWAYSLRRISGRVQSYLDFSHWLRVRNKPRPRHQSAANVVLIKLNANVRFLSVFEVYLLSEKHSPKNMRNSGISVTQSIIFVPADLDIAANEMKRSNFISYEKKTYQCRITVSVHLIYFRCNVLSSKVQTRTTTPQSSSRPRTRCFSIHIQSGDF